MYPVIVAAYEGDYTMAIHSSTPAWKIPWVEDPVGCHPWGLEESDTAERLHFHYSLSCTGEGNGNPLQCSCLENPRDGGAWWASVYGVAQSRTRLKRLSCSREAGEMNMQSTEDFQGVIFREITPYDTIVMDTVNKWAKTVQVASPKKISDYQ